MAPMDGRREAAAWLSVLPTALDLAYATMGGVHADPVVRWLLASASALGTGAVWRAAHRGPWALAWPGALLIAAPAVPSWPAIAVSVGGLLALLSMAVAILAIAVASLPRPRPPALSPG